MLVLKLLVHAVDLVNCILEFKTQRDLLVEGLIRLLEILHQDLSLISQVRVLVFETFQLLVHTHVLLFVQLLVLLYDLLPSLYLNFQLLHFSKLIPLDFSNQSLIISCRAIFQ